MIITASSSSIPAIPADIALPLFKAQTAVKTIEYDAVNKHGDYKYASVDAIYKGARAALADNKIGLLLLEVGFEALEGRNVRFTYQFVLFGEKSTWTHETARRSIVLPWNGPQTAQAAQSYVEKALLKSLLKIETGDEEPEGNEEGPKKAAPKPAKKAEPLDAAAADGIVSKALAELATFKAMDPEEVAAFAEKWAPDLAQLDEARKGRVRAELKSKTKKG